MRLGVATPQDCVIVDATWSPIRPAAQDYRIWSWEAVEPKLRDVFVLSGDDGPIAIWGSKIGRPLKLREAPLYRLDFVEIHPSYRGDDRVLGLFALATVAARAAEVGASGIVMAAFSVPGLVRFYTGAGAEERKASGWSCGDKLVPLIIVADAFKALLEFTDDCIEEDEPEG